MDVAAYRVVVKSTFEKDCRRIPKAIAVKIIRRSMELANDPRPPQCKKLQDSPYWRIRIGDYRVIYLIDDADRRVDILGVDHRRDAYRRL